MYKVKIRDGLGIETTVLHQASYEVMRAAVQAIRSSGNVPVVITEKGLRLYPKAA